MLVDEQSFLKRQFRPRVEHVDNFAAIMPAVRCERFSFSCTAALPQVSFAPSSQACGLRLRANPFVRGTITVKATLLGAHLWENRPSSRQAFLRRTQVVNGSRGAEFWCVYRGRSMADMNTRTITAFFDNRTSAQKASDDLSAIGVPRGQIRITEGSNTSAGATAQPHKGFWEELKSLFMPEEDRYGYAEGLRRGGYLLSAQVDGSLYDHALSVLDTEGAVDMDEREASWKSSGWTGYQAGSGAAQTTGTVEVRKRQRCRRPGKPQLRPPSSTPVATKSFLSMRRPQRSASVTSLMGAFDCAVMWSRTPVTEQVNLRSEQVQVERRPVDRVVSPGDAVFQDRAIEAEEHVEEAVVGKETRVKEEISLRKTVENQEKTVSETLRRTEVEIQDDRAGQGVGQGFVASTDANRITAHMDVIASDGAKIGTVDHLDGARIKLTKLGSPDGQHHFVPLAWIDHVDAHVHLNKSAGEAKASW